jgi:predicted DsbA family dithiol-disulfide isomerase
MDEELNKIANDYGLDREEAEEVRDVADEFGLDTDDAHEIWESM